MIDAQGTRTQSARSRAGSTWIKVASVLSAGAALVVAAEPPRITTSQYDNMRTGANLRETILNPMNVNVGRFGKLWSLSVDGDVYAQPLYMPAVSIPGKGVHNLLFVATEHDSVYAFDADENATTAIWHVNLLPAGGLVTTVPASDVNCQLISPEIWNYFHSRD
jgi:hypothetical protein